MSVLVVASEMGCPSQVADPRSSPWFIDRAPVEEALRLRESGKADEVVVMSVGDLKARILLRLALGMGADRAVVVPIEDEPSVEETSRLVTAVAAREHPDRHSPGRVGRRGLREDLFGLRPRIDHANRE